MRRVPARRQNRHVGWRSEVGADDLRFQTWQAQDKTRLAIANGTVGAAGAATLRRVPAPCGTRVEESKSGARRYLGLGWRPPFAFAEAVEFASELLDRLIVDHVLVLGQLPVVGHVLRHFGRRIALGGRGPGLTQGVGYAAVHVVPDGVGHDVDHGPGYPVLVRERTRPELPLDHHRVALAQAGPDVLAEPAPAADAVVRGIPVAPLVAHPVLHAGRGAHAQVGHENAVFGLALNWVLGHEAHERHVSALAHHDPPWDARQPDAAGPPTVAARRPPRRA